MSRKYLIDLAERVGATAAEAGLSYGITLLADLPAWWVAPLTVAASAAKGWLAGWLGRKDTAALLPAVSDPASQR